MRKSQFSEEQMVAILREADAMSVAATAKKLKVSEQTIYAWRKHFGELAPSDVKRLCACGLIGLSRSCLHNELRLPAKDAPVIEAMKTRSSQYPRDGYRHIRILLRRASHELGVRRARRLWRQAEPQLPRRRPRSCIATGRPRPLPTANSNFLWTYDSVFDATATGQQIKCLTVVDEFTRECLVIDLAGSIRSKRAIEVLS